MTGLAIAFGPHRATWSCPDLRRLGEWLGRRPWLERPELAVVAAPSCPELDELARDVGDWAVGADGGLSNLRVATVVARGGDRPLLHKAAEELAGAADSADTRACSDAIRSAFELYPVCLVVDLRAANADGWLDAVRTLRDLGPGGDAAHYATIVTLVDARQASGADAFDLSAARPLRGVVEQFDGTDRQVWGRYVHVRVFWELAGELARVSSAAADFAASPARLGDDDAFERFLDRVAERMFEALGAEQAARLVSYLEDICSPSVVRERVRPLLETLLAERLLVRHHPGLPAVPPPWAARALLRRDGCPAAEGLLLRQLTCRPLAAELLLVCLHLEDVIRGRGVPSLADASVPESVAEEWARFTARSDDSDARFYPVDTPATPRHPWEFATFGSFIHALDPDRGTKKSLHDLRRLRNALAHGRYAGWRTVTETRKLASVLSPV